MDCLCGNNSDHVFIPPGSTCLAGVDSGYVSAGECHDGAGWTICSGRTDPTDRSGRTAVGRSVPVYHVQKFLLAGEVSWFAVGERLAAAAVLTVLYPWTRENVDKICPETEVLWKTYLCGVCAYLLLCSSSYYASRYGAIFKVVECALVVDLAMGQEKIQKAVAIFFFCLTCLWV